MILTRGTTSRILDIFIKDSGFTDDRGLTGLAYNTSSLTCYYHRNKATTATAVTLVTMTVGTFTSGGFKEIDATNMPGWYQLCLPDAAFAIGADLVSVELKGATGMQQTSFEIELIDLDLSKTVASAFDEPLASHTTPGTTGSALNNLDSPISTIADPLAKTVPGSYGAGTAGLAISKLFGVGSSSPISVVSPVALGGSITLLLGDDYLNADNRALSWTDNIGVWPTLTGATVNFIVKDPVGTSDFTKSVTVDVATGANKKVEVDLTAANLASIYALFVAGQQDFRVTATLASSHVVTLVYSNITFLV